MNISVRYQYNESDAKDVVNTSYIKILEHLSDYDIAQSFESWASRICINTNIDFFRKTKKISRREVLHDNYDESVLTNYYVENEAMDFLNREALFDMIKVLPSMMKEVFVLFAVDGYNHKEIASLLSMSEVGSRYYLFEARKRLKKLIEKEIHGSKIRSI